MNTDGTMQAIIVGAQRKRQGTGPFLANMLHRQAHRITAVVGSNIQNAQTAAHALKNDIQVEVPAYANLKQALKNHPADSVIIASPYETHINLLEQIGETPCHVFCEKPLFWTAADKPIMPLSEITTITTNITKLFSQHKKVLHINTQWIYTLPYFMCLHPETSLLPEDIRVVEMGLSPMSTGNAMLVDALPHFVSLLQGCFSHISLSSLTVRYTNNQKSLRLQGICKHAHGETDIQLELCYCKTIPRPAWYAINGKRIDRHIKMPEYSLSLLSDNQTISIRDPMELSLEDFAIKIQTTQTDNHLLLNSMQCLHQSLTAADPL